MNKALRHLFEPLRRKYLNLSLTKKVEWKRIIQKAKDDQKKTFPELYRDDGSVDLIALANRSQRLISQRI